MKYIRILILTVSLVFCLSFSLHAQNATQLPREASLGVPAQDNKNLSWSMGLQNIKTGDFIQFSAPVQSKTGDQFRMVIEAKTTGFFYVVAESSGSNEMAVIYAGSLKDKEIWQSPVFQLIPPGGSESFFVITSKNEQKNLAQRINAFNANPGVSQRRALMNEIQKVRSEASKFKEVPEKPVLMGGASRGTPDQNKGVEFSGAQLYIKTISISHD